MFKISEMKCWQLHQDTQILMKTKNIHKCIQTKIWKIWIKKVKFQINEEGINKENQNSRVTLSEDSR